MNVVPGVVVVMVIGLVWSCPVAVEASAHGERPSIQHGMGLIVDPGRGSSAAGLGRIRREDAVTENTADLPSSVDLSRWDVAVGDQGLVNSCVSWAIGYSMAGWYANRYGGHAAPLAPMYLYSQIQAARGTQDKGTSPTENYAILASQGIDRQASYSQGTHDWRDLPTAEETRAAAANRARGGYELLDADGGTLPPAALTEVDLKTALANDQPVEIGFGVFKGFENLSSVDDVMDESDATGPVLGGHAVLAVAYNKTGVLIENSWGTGWGSAGYAWLNWAFVKDQVYEATVMDGFIGTPTNPPVLTAISPAHGTIAGGDVVVLTGTGLGDLKAVKIDGVESRTDFSRAAGRTLHVRMPAHRAGKVDLSVIGPTGASSNTLVNSYTYALPIRPTHGGGRAAA